MKKISIQIISDLHLEFYKSIPKFKPNAKYLCLAGDIGTIETIETIETIGQNNGSKIEEFLSYCSDSWEKTFYILGNHEFYQSNEFVFKKTSMEDLELKYKTICDKFPNVFLLNNSFEEIVPGLNIYGTTLWTNNYGYRGEPYEILNDYNMIAIKTKESEPNVLLTTKYINKLSSYQLENLSNYLKQNLTKTIIMTHFPPIRNGISNPKYNSQPIYMRNYFSWNNICSKLDCNNIIGWIGAHTHWSYDFIQNNVRHVSNQVGYSNEFANGSSGFDPDKIFEFEF